MKLHVKEVWLVEAIAPIIISLLGSTRKLRGNDLSVTNTNAVTVIMTSWIKLTPRCLEKVKVF